MLSYQHTFNGTTLCTASSYKYIGIHLTHNLFRNLHIDTSATQTSRTLGYIKRNFKSLPPHLGKLAYDTHIRSKLEYQPETLYPRQWFLTQKNGRHTKMCCTHYHFEIPAWNQYNSTKAFTWYRSITYTTYDISPAPSSPFLQPPLICPRLISRTYRPRLIPIA